MAKKILSIIAVLLVLALIVGLLVYFLGDKGYKGNIISNESVSSDNSDEDLSKDFGSGDASSEDNSLVGVERITDVLTPITLVPFNDGQNPYPGYPYLTEMPSAFYRYDIGWLFEFEFYNNHYEFYLLAKIVDDGLYDYYIYDKSQNVGLFCSLNSSFSGEKNDYLEAGFYLADECYIDGIYGEGVSQGLYQQFSIKCCIYV